MNYQARVTDGGQLEKLVKTDITCWSIFPTAITIPKELGSFNQMMKIRVTLLTSNFHLSSIW